MRRDVLITLALTAVLALVAPAAASAEIGHPANPAPSWFTDDFKQKVDASGPTGVPVREAEVYDVCPGAVIHENGVGTGTCLVVPFGCTANFVYYSGGGTVAGRVSSGGAYSLGTAGHCVEKVGEPVYGAVSTPGAGPAIRRIGTVAKFVNDYPDNANFHDFAQIKLDDGQNVYPDSPVGGPQGIYDGCDAGEPIKYYGHGYEVAVAQGKPGVGVTTVFYDDNYGWAGLINGGDSGSGVLHADDRAIGNLTATALIYPPWIPGESVGSRVTWILSYLGSSYYLVNQDYTLARDTTSPCGTPDSGDGGGGGGGGKNGGGKGGGGKSGKGGGKA
jgi:hypothetical protein